MVQHNTIDHTGLTGVSTVSYASNANSVAVANTGGAATTQSRGDHVHLGVRSISHTSNTFSGPVTFTTEGDLGITSPSTGTLAFKAISGAGGGAGGSATASENFLTGNVTMTNANTNYDGPSLSCAAGTYVFMGVVSMQRSGGPCWFTAKLWDGSTQIGDCPAAYSTTTGGGVALPLFGYAVLGSTTTIKISCSSDAAGAVILQTAAANGVPSKASHLIALKIA